MGFFNYNKAQAKFRDNDYVLETLRRLQMFDEFHCLRNSSLLLAGRVADEIGHAPQAYIAWMTVCNGGLLFDTTLLSITEYDPELHIPFSTLSEYNRAQVYTDYALPEGYRIIGIRSYGAPLCLSCTDDKVYLWDDEEGMFSTVWDSFYDFLADETDTAITLIANEDLEPIPIKLSGDDAHE